MKNFNLKTGLMALAMGLTIVSCGGGSKTKDGKIDAEQVVKEELKQAKIENRFSEEAALIYMKSVGLTKADLAPYFDYVIPEKGCYG